MNSPGYSKDPPEFLTVTCLEWKYLLQDNRFKDILIESMSFLNEANRVSIYAFVIMSNHFHLILQILGNHKKSDVQRDFLKYTSQQILKILRNEKTQIRDELVVNAKDRKFQVWERNSLGIPLPSHGVFLQKMKYIHCNPVKAGLCKYPEEYAYSSAGFYYKSEKRWNFITHYEG
jgi:REP element-mobilizing transposase RayT